MSMKKFIAWDYELLSHPISFPDLAFSELFLILNLNQYRGGERFDPSDETIALKNDYFEDIDKFYYLKVVNNLEKCVEFKSDSVDK